MEKSLEEKAIDIKGKKYVLVSDRIIYFNETYPKGAITTQIESSEEAQRIIVRATVYPEFLFENTAEFRSQRHFTAYSQAVIGEGYINKTSALENAETSAVGRALAMMGIGVIDSIASVDEIHKAEASMSTPPIKTSVRPVSSPTGHKIMEGNKGIGIGTQGTAGYNDKMRLLEHAKEEIEMVETKAQNTGSYSELKNQCPFCKTWHDGKYPKCLQCWQKEQRTVTKAVKTKSITNPEAVPFS